jgi:GTP-binding protein HflX
VTALVPYDRGDLVARVHRRGDLISSEHREDGTLLRVRVDERLAAELSRYAVAESGHPIPR